MPIIRVFPTKTNMTPTDNYAFCGYPPFPQFIPEHDEVHISVTFTWDIQKAYKLQKAWEAVTNKPVKIGGVAFGDPGNSFSPGMYLKKGIVITSMGCPNNCWFCFVPKREGGIRELSITEGHIIQDNNFLACSRSHRLKVYEMLKAQSDIKFLGGLEAKRLTDWDIEQMRGLKIHELWLACDTRAVLPKVIDTINRLKSRGFKQNQIRCYVLIGFDMREEHDRLIELLKAGCLPFAQLYQPEQKREYDYNGNSFKECGADQRYTNH